MKKQETKVLSTKEKMEFFKKLSESYKNAESVYWEYWIKKALVFDMFIERIDLVKENAKVKKDFTDKELLILVKRIFTKEYLDDIFSKCNKITKAAIETGIGAIAWIICNSQCIFEEENKVIQEFYQNKKGLTFNTWIFDFYKNKCDDPELIEPNDN